MEKEDKIVVHIVMSTKGNVAIATEDKGLAEDILNVRKAECTDPDIEVYDTITLSAPRDRAIRAIKLGLEKKKNDVP